MGDRNQRHFLARHKYEGPVLEVGSRDANGNTQDFGGIGVDLEPGPGVDVVLDLSQGIGELTERSFGLIVCCSVLEHVRDPWAMARNLTRLLKPGGTIYVSVPWTWRYHAYPDDYWRFSWSGIRELFPEIEWEPAEFSTTREGEFFPAVPDADNNLATVIEGRKFIPYLALHMIGTWTETSK